MDGQTDRQTDRQTDKLIRVGLGNLRFLQVKQHTLGKYGRYSTTAALWARVTIEKFWARTGREAGKKIHKF